MTEHPSIELLSRYLAGRTSAEESQLVEQHIVQCADCTSQLDKISSQGDAFEAKLVASAQTSKPDIERSSWITPGTAVGSYTLRELLGQGGMGQVWQAEQTEPIKRTVAIKLIKSDLAGRQVLARFEAERQALTMMDHPNIARILDAGAMPDGKPYFVMELVRGVPINRYCDEARLNTEERLALFIPVCQAIQHAHQKGIIHRDLKPSNILITQYDGKPVPKVIDFGVAKAVHQPLTDQSMQTELGSLIGTLEYMSPEQADLNNLDIDTRADIYSLGVILYELLAGSPPFTSKQLRAAAFTEMLRLIREIDPPKPSTKLSKSEALPSIAANRKLEPRRLQSLVTGDLDWIVMKALAKERNQRYESANGFAQDIQRYLVNEPVQAGPPSASYRLRKFVQRNRGKVLAAGLVFLALIAGVIGTTYGMLEANTQATKANNEAAAKEKARAAEAAEREKAEKARDRTRQALDAMISEVTGDSLTTQLTVSPEQRKFLDGVLSYYNEFSKDPASDEKSLYRSSIAAFQLGRIEQRLDRKEKSLAALQQAEEGFAKLATAHPAVPEYRSKWASSLLNAGMLLRGLGRQTEAEAKHRQALKILDKLSADVPADHQYQSELASCLTNLGSLQVSLGRRDDASAQYLQGLSVLEKLAKDHPATLAYQDQLADCHVGWGNLLMEQNKLSDAEKQLRLGLALREKMAKEQAGSITYLSRLAACHNTFGVLLIRARKMDSVEQHYQQAVNIQEKVVHEFPAALERVKELASYYLNLGNFQRNTRKLKEAEDHYRKALAIREKHAGETPESFTNQVSLGAVNCEYGVLLRMADKPEAGLPLLNKAVAILQTAYEKEPRLLNTQRYLRNSYWNRAMTLEQLKKYREALSDFDKAVSLATQPELRLIRAARVNSLLLGNKITEAVTEVDELSKTPPWRAVEWSLFARVYAKAGSGGVENREQYLDRAMAMLHKAVESGYKNAAQLKQDNDLVPLRDRVDFKQLIQKLETTSPAK
jgi:serine/threonine protein kinase